MHQVYQTIVILIEDDAILNPGPVRPGFFFKKIVTFTFLYTKCKSQLLNLSNYGERRYRQVFEFH
jgi:hypothetical protein